jgi:hypothetical protein
MFVVLRSLKYSLHWCRKCPTDATPFARAAVPRWPRDTDRSATARDVDSPIVSSQRPDQSAISSLFLQVIAHLIFAVLLFGGRLIQKSGLGGEPPQHLSLPARHWNRARHTRDAFSRLDRRRRKLRVKPGRCAAPGRPRAYSQRKIQWTPLW